MAGKWDDKAFPKSGWICEGVSKDEMVCEMCEYKQIVYVHSMRHVSGLYLKTGCVCAGKLEEDIDSAKKRERAFKAKIVRAKRLAYEDWRPSHFNPNQIMQRTKTGELLVVSCFGGRFFYSFKFHGQPIKGGPYGSDEEARRHAAWRFVGMGG